jgi:hypothetical protein
MQIRCHICLYRESALSDLASAYSDMQAMQAALLDSALYVRFLRAKLLELQLSEHRFGSQGERLNCSSSWTLVKMLVKRVTIGP